MPITIVVRTEGPYRITAEPGEVILVDQDGNAIPIPTNKPTIALCRCGASTKKPFCDGTHSKLGFRAAEEARAEYDAQLLAAAGADPNASGGLPPSAAPTLPPG
jgi:CDGSH-type Zn-finger protein